MSSDKNADAQTVRAGAASVKVEVTSPTVMMRVYFSSYHLWAAQHFARCAEEIENEPGETPRFDIKHRANVTGAVLSATAFVEAAVNELFKDVVDGHESYISVVDDGSRKLIKAFWELTEERNRSPFSILDKYQIVLTFCREEQFPAGAQPYQDADLAIKLRNELMHYKPESYGGETQHKFFKQLPTKFADNPLMAGSGNPYFPDKCLGSPCAKWVIQAAQALADTFFERLKLVPIYQRVKF
jgi:hypothetical protein